MAEVGEKLRLYFDSQGISQVDIAEKLGVSKAYVNALFNGNSTFGKKTAEKWEAEFGISKSFLLTGNGQMLVGGQNVIGNKNTTTQNNGNHNTTNNTTNNTTTNNYRGCGGADAKAAKEIADMGDRITALEDSNDIYTIPLLPVSAQGGSLNDFVVSVKDSDCEKIISPIKGADYAISVAGDSMAPEYPSGSQILIKRINERAFIDWGRVYVLDTCNGTVIKRLFPSENADKVICKSINPDYPPFEVSMTDIYGVYRVLMCMSVK